MTVFPWRGIIIHHTLTRDSGTVSWDAIRQYHKNPNGPYRMREIGYHAGIERIGPTLEILVGRPLDWYGAHTRGSNASHLGLVFVGNYDLEEPTDEMYQVAAERVIRPWMKLFDIPLKQIKPHSAFSHKSCPGEMFSMARLKAAIMGLDKADI